MKFHISKTSIRGDLIITRGILYFLPHTRVSASHYASEIGGADVAEAIGLLGNFVPLIGLAPYIHTAVDKSVKLGKFLGRIVAPTVNRPRISKIHLWHSRHTDKSLQN